MKKESKLPNMHSRINVNSIKEYEEKIVKLKKMIEMDKEKYSYFEFNRKHEINETKETPVISNYFSLTIDNTQKFLNLKDSMSINSLIINYVAKNGKKEANELDNFEAFMHSFLNSFYKVVNVKLTGKKLITINDILLLIKNYEKETRELSAFLNVEFMNNESFDLFNKGIKEFSLNEILDEMMEVDFNINHQDVVYSHLFYSHHPLTFTNIDEFYKKVILNAIVKSAVVNILGTRIGKDQFLKRPIFDSFIERKKVFIIFDKAFDDDFLKPYMYAQLRGLGVKLIIPNILDNVSEQCYVERSIEKIDF